MRKTATMGILFRAGRRNRMSVSQPTGRMKRRSPTTPFQRMKMNRSEMRITPLDWEILLYAAAHRGTPFRSWPTRLRNAWRVEKLRVKGYVKRFYEPERYILTRYGV